MTDDTGPTASEHLGLLRGFWQYLIAKVNAKKEIEQHQIALQRD